jgi:nucleoside-diphosphate-sugar epimerase
VNVLFIGGTGIISSACSELALGQGVDLTLLTRGQSSRSHPERAQVIRADITDGTAVAAALRGKRFDAVVNWVAFTPDDIKRDIALFRGRTNQYIFISSASAYQTPPLSLPVLESTPLRNPFWAYSRAKIACEEALMTAYRAEGFPATIVRPSHTYDRRLLPFFGGYTVIDRMRQGRPIIVHGDGTSLWVLTHHQDFAKGFVGLLANPHAIGESFHITTDEVLTWNQIAAILAKAAGTEARIVHVPSVTIGTFHKEWGDSLLGDKSHSMIFDNSKIKRFVPDFAATIPFARGAEEILAWYDADSARRTIDDAANALFDRIIQAQEGVSPA